MVGAENFEKFEISSEEQLRSWLMKNHRQLESIWLVTHKKSEPDWYVSRWAVLNELKCFGWIDGIRRKLDDKKTMQLRLQRKVEHWAGRYNERVAKLIDEGKMHQSGLKAVGNSKSKGLWDLMDVVDKLIVPQDLSEEISKLDGAAVFFLSINDSSKRFMLRWVKLAKTEKTRKNGIKKLVLLSAQGKKLRGI